MKKVTYLFFLVVISGFTFTGCIKTLENGEVEKKESPFFDLEGFMDSEARRLADIKAIEKTITYKGEEEFQKLDSFDLENEFAPFVNADINKLSWIDKYQIDTILDRDDQLRQLHFEAKVEDIPVKKMKVHFLNGEVVHIEIEKQMESAIATTDQYLSYKPENGYTIKTRQEGLLSSEEEISLVVTWNSGRN